MRLKKTIHLFSILLLGLLISYCSTSQNYYLEPDFENEKIESSLFVIPVERSLFNGFEHYAFSALRGTEKTIFETSLSPYLSEFSNSNVKIMESKEPLDEEDFEIDSLETSESKFAVLLPKSGTQVLNNEETPRFVLLLDQFYFRALEKTIGGSSYAGHEGQSIRRTLVFETKYVYWDNEKREAVGWGVANADLNFQEEPSNEDYSKLLEQALEDIVKRGPLKSNG